jgi:hypothetical protein
MADSGTLTIINAIPGTNLQITCDNANFNCCDQPVPGAVIGNLKPNTTISYTCLRKDGHGCNGCQGVWVLDVLGNSLSLGSQPFQIDGNGCIDFNGSNTGAFSSYLVGAGGSNVTWIILPVIS